MRISILAIAFILVHLQVRAQEIDFTGIYTHDFEGEKSYLEVIQEDALISGELHDYRGIYYLHGSLEEKRAKGLINLGNEVHFFEMDILGDHLHLYIINMTEYGEPDYATQYDLLFLEDSTAEKPKKTSVNPFGSGSENSEGNYITSGTINAPYLGLQFKIPRDFKAENHNSDIVLIPTNGFGRLFIFRHDFDKIDRLEKFLKKGYSDKEMNLIISNTEKQTDSLIVMEAKGYYGGAKVKVDGLANIGPHGHGVILFYIMREDEYLSRAKDELEIVMKTMNFFPIEEHPLAQRWTYDLQGKSLKYGKSANSSKASNDLLTSTAWINLCPDMTFKMVEPDDDGKKKVLEGKWNVEVHYSVPHLNLQTKDDIFQTYKLQHENGRLLMNNERWMVLKGFESECDSDE